MRFQNILWLAVLMVTGLFACKKTEVGKTGDSIPANAVTVTNAIAFRPDPTVSTSKSGGGNIQMVLTLSSETGRTIKEITKVAASTSYTQIQSTGASGFYNAAPISVNGLTATFNTTITEYIAKAGPINPNPPASNAELPKRFYFLLTLDDNSTIVTTPVRVLVLD